MLLFIHANFRLDLTYLKVTFQERNQLFTDEFSTEISFPFDFDLAGEFKKNPDFSAHYNFRNKKTVFDGILSRDGEMVKATLTIQESKGNVAAAIIKAGADGFPNFKKKLSELPLATQNVPDIHAHALTIINKDYPEVNYNFPMIHIDKYKEDGSFPDFGNILNNYSAGAFLKNSISSDNVDSIRNIMQPLPYFMHVLKTAILDAGYVLAGDILTDYDLSRALLCVDAQYYVNYKTEKISFSVNIDEWVAEAFWANNYRHVRFEKSVTIQKNGIYSIEGISYFAIYMRQFGSASTISLTIQVLTPGGTVQVYSGTNNFQQALPGTLDIVAFDISHSGLHLRPGDVVKFTKIEVFREGLNHAEDYPQTLICDIIPVRYLDDSDNALVLIDQINNVDCKKTVPDVTVEELVTFIKNSKNYDFNTVGDSVVMNKIIPQLSRSAAVKFSDTDIEEPKRVYHGDRSYEMVFADASANADYKYDSVFLDRDGVKVNNYLKNESTNIISVSGLPLPVIRRDNVNTAFLLDDEPSKIRLVFYKAILPAATHPVSFHNPNFLIPKLLENNFLAWLNFRINCDGWEWEFVISVEKFRMIKIQSLIYAYDNYHLFTEIEKERLDLEWWRVTAKTENLI